MKYIYYHLWVGLAFMHTLFSKVFVPINMFIMKIGKKSEREHKNWRNNYNKAIYKFPGGINDWFAFGLLLVLVFIPIIVFTVKYKIDIYTSKQYFWILFIGVGTFVYYWIYFKNLDWIKERIRKIENQYYV